MPDAGPGEARGELVDELGGERRRAAHDETEGRQVVLADFRALHRGFIRSAWIIQ